MRLSLSAVVFLGILITALVAATIAFVPTYQSGVDGVDKTVVIVRQNVIARVDNGVRLFFEAPMAAAASWANYAAAGYDLLSDRPRMFNLACRALRDFRSVVWGGISGKCGLSPLHWCDFGGFYDHHKKEKTFKIPKRRGFGGQYYIRNVLDVDYVPWERKMRARFPGEAFAKTGHIFMDDGASGHKCTVAQVWWVKQHKNADLPLRDLRFHPECANAGFAWPPKSPDLNPIENMWAILKHFKNIAAPNTAEELMKVVNSSVQLEKVQQQAKNLARSFKKRCQKCIDADGDFLRY